MEGSPRVKKNIELNNRRTLNGPSISVNIATVFTKNFVIPQVVVRDWDSV